MEISVGTFYNHLTWYEVLLEFFLRRDFYIFCILNDKKLSVAIVLKASVFITNWQTWRFLFEHESLPKYYWGQSEALLNKWSFKLFLLQNHTIGTLGNTFWHSLSGASRIRSSLKIVLVCRVICYIKCEFLFFLMITFLFK